jgi:hypothetical protein
MSKQRGPRTTFVRREKSIRRLVQRIRPQSAKSNRANFNIHQGFSGVHLSFTPPPETISALLNRGWHRAYARPAQTPAVPPRKNFLICWVSRARSVRDANEDEASGRAQTPRALSSFPQVWTTRGTTGALLCPAERDAGLLNRIQPVSPWREPTGKGMRGTRSTT